MRSERLLRFKVITSFAIAGLGGVMCVRLGHEIAVNASTLIDFLAPIMFVLAGVWRGCILLKALKGFRDLAKT